MDAHLQGERVRLSPRYDLEGLARRGGKMTNDELAALWVRAANHLLDLPPGSRIGVRPKTITAREEAAKAARKAFALIPGLPAAEAVLKRAESRAATER